MISAVSAPPHVREIRQVAYHRHRMLALLLDGLLHLVELAAVATDQDDRAVLGQLESREATYAGGRAGNDVRLALLRIDHQSSLCHILSN